MTKDCWFQNSSKIFEYLESHCDSRMSDINLDAKTIDKNRLKKGFKITAHMSQHSSNMYQMQRLYSLENIYAAVTNAYC